jgi:hypothetical protein
LAIKKGVQFAVLIKNAGWPFSFDHLPSLSGSAYRSSSSLKVPATILQRALPQDVRRFDTAGEFLRGLPPRSLSMKQQRHDFALKNREFLEAFVC